MNVVNADTPRNVRWLPVAMAVRLTGLSDETLRKHCAAGVFLSARLRDGRWEIPEDELRAAKIIDRSVIVRRTGVSDAQLAQLERLGNLASSEEGRFSLDQEVYLQGIKKLPDLTAASPFVETEARTEPTSSHESDASQEVAHSGDPAATAAASDQPGAQGEGRPAQPAIEEFSILVTAGVPLLDAFVAYMVDHMDVTRLPDEMFAGEYAPEFIPPVGITQHVCLGPGPDDGEGPSGTWVRRYAYWTYEARKLVCHPECEVFLEGGVQLRGTVPAELAGTTERYRMLEGLWNARAAEARERLAARARALRAPFLTRFTKRPDTRRWLRRYQEEGMHPSEFPASVKMELADVEFFPPYNVFYRESTGELRRSDPDDAASEYTVVSCTPGFSDDLGLIDDGMPLLAEHMWPGRHPKCDVPSWARMRNAVYRAAQAAWDEMRREGRRLRERREEG